MLKAVVFDFDGTLVNTNEFHLHAFQKAFFELFGKKISEKQVSELLGESFTVIAKRIFLMAGLKFSEKLLKDFRKQYLIHFNEKLAGKKLIKPSVFKFLKSLKNSGLKLGIASGTSRKLLFPFLRNEEKELFASIITADDVNHSKPSPEMLLKVLKKLKVKPSEAVYVGDAFFDSLCAKRARVGFIGVLSGITSRKEFNELPNLVIVSKISEVSKTIKKLLC